MNNLRRGENQYIYAARTEGVETGQCAAFGNGSPDFGNPGCGIFLEGPPDCKGSGDDMWNGAQQIRGSRCAECGVKYFKGEAGSDCKLKIDHVSECFPNQWMEEWLRAAWWVRIWALLKKRRKGRWHFDRSFG